MTPRALGLGHELVLLMRLSGRALVVRLSERAPVARVAAPVATLVMMTGLTGSLLAPRGP